MNTPAPERIVFVEPKAAKRTDNREGVPFDSKLFDRIPMVAHRRTPPEACEDPGYNLVRPTANHGRAFDARFGNEAASEPQVIFGDEYGNIFTSIGTKGNDCKDVYALRNELEPSGLRVIGLQDGSLIPRVIALSERLRAAGVDTEWIVSSSQPRSFPISAVDGKFALLPLKALKESVRQRTEDEHREGGRLEGYPTEDFDALDGLDFAVSYRALKTPYRLADIDWLTIDRTEVMGGIIKIHNMEEEIRSRRDNNYEPLYIEETPDGYHTYITRVLPQKIGRNVAKMHNLGMSHKYLHSGNISLLGGIYDLDSVDCPELFVEDEKLDIQASLSDLIHTLRSGGEPKWLRRMRQAYVYGNVTLENGFTREGMERCKDFSIFLDNLIGSYLTERDIQERPEIEVVFRAAQYEIIKGVFGPNKPRDDEFPFKYLPEAYSQKINELFEEILADEIRFATSVGTARSTSTGTDISDTYGVGVHSTNIRFKFFSEAGPELEALEAAYDRKLRRAGYRTKDRQLILTACRSLSQRFILSKIMPRQFRQASKYVLKGESTYRKQRWV